ncbi:hypothetical protein HDU92_003349 [Lobulomyces angularis]|nr:hypothetical protein HDU92_003349 [Lobulomyces angularis]
MHKYSVLAMTYFFMHYLFLVATFTGFQAALELDNLQAYAVLHRYYTNGRFIYAGVFTVIELALNIAMIRMVITVNAKTNVKKQFKVKVTLYTLLSLIFVLNAAFTLVGVFGLEEEYTFLAISVSWFHLMVSLELLDLLFYVKTKEKSEIDDRNFSSEKSSIQVSGTGSGVSGFSSVTDSVGGTSKFSDLRPFESQASAY